MTDAKPYDPKEVEDKYYQFWETSGFFKADPHSKKPAYCIVIPPPNVTGALHMGHALVDTLQDVLIRWKRMSGFEALWVPGTDHAGIATQTVVEKNLIAQTGKRRKDFSREEFLGHVWDWKAKSEDRILSQIKKLGCSCDWSRLSFTMDESRNRAVKAVFKKMFDDGLIYRGDYLVNWDPVTQTALADDEVEYEEKASFLWTFRYPLSDGSGFIDIATTRPETMLGDTAVAVSPDDPRYRSLIGKTLTLPITGRTIPIIAHRLVDAAFGTGAVKVTPAHDPNDYQMGLSENLPFINIMTPDGKINEQGAPFTDLSMEEARYAVVEKMKALGHLIKTEPHKHRVGVSYRSKAIIEPYLSKQWFVRMEAFKPKLRALVENKTVKLIPDSWESTYFHWIDNLRDWCISRQLWWGHRIPIWYNRQNPEQMICEDLKGVPEAVQADPESWVQDEDVLDTWFSSALWPFSTLGWPDNSPDLKKFYPNSTLITGHDILFFWVARMLAMGTYVLDKPPFPETFLHGLIYGKSYWRNDKQGGITYLSSEEKLPYDLGKPLPAGIFSKWEKMSKSKGNVIDPLEIIETFGTDAMRMALCSSATQARQIDLDRRRFEEFKNFTNKVWNGARFVFMNLEDFTLVDLEKGMFEAALNLEDRWILSLLDKTIETVQTSLEAYAFDKAASAAYDFFWREFCAYYVELSKPILFGKAGSLEQRKNKQVILTVVLTSVIRLLHPMAPFITEELFQKLKTHFGTIKETSSDPYTQECLQALQSPACIIAPYPTPIQAQGEAEAAIEKTFSIMGEIVHAIRNIRTEMQIPPGTETDLIFSLEESDPHYPLISQNLAIITSLIKVKIISFNPKDSSDLASSAFVKEIKISIPLPDTLKEKERLRLIKEQEKLTAEASKLQEKLSQPEFLAKAPAAVRQKLEENQKTVALGLEEIHRKIQSLS